MRWRPAWASRSSGCSSCREPAASAWCSWRRRWSASARRSSIPSRRGWRVPRPAVVTASPSRSFRWEATSGPPSARCSPPSSSCGTVSRALRGSLWRRWSRWHSCFASAGGSSRAARCTRRGMRTRIRKIACRSKTSSSPSSSCWRCSSRSSSTSRALSATTRFI